MGKHPMERENRSGTYQTDELWKCYPFKILGRLGKIFSANYIDQAFTDDSFLME